jgi:hypothetical protein
MRPKSKPFAKVQLFSRRPKPRHRSRVSPCQIAALRMRDLGILYRARYRGEQLPDDDAGRDDMMVAVNHLASLAHPKGRIEGWLDMWCPWLSRAESAEIIAKAIIHQQHWTADQLAWRFNLLDEDRTYLGITTIGAVDCMKAERIKRRKAKSAERTKRYKRRLKLAKLTTRLQRYAP